MKIGLIGAGSIARYHLEAYQKNAQAEVCVLCDANPETAKALAEEFGIAAFCTDYRKILEDPAIDAVDIVTPTFTHKTMVTEALQAGKHVLCEKPPARNVEETRAICQAAEASDKVLMFAFIKRFSKDIQFIKSYVDSGAAGEIYYADMARMTRCSMLGGWFVDKEKSGGGTLIDGAIHELDAALYLMGFPKIKSVKGFTSHRNSHLPDVMKGVVPNWQSAEKKVYDRTIETVASGYVQFENEACLYVKASFALNTVKEGIFLDLCGTKAGFNITDGKLKMVTVDDSGYYMDAEPVLTAPCDSFYNEINHFVDCCLNGTECLVKPWQAVEVMKIISAIYESAETGKEILF